MRSRLAGCPECGLTRETAAQPRTRLRCRGCGAAFLAPAVDGAGGGVDPGEGGPNPGRGGAPPPSTPLSAPVVDVALDFDPAPVLPPAAPVVTPPLETPPVATSVTDPGLPPSQPDPDVTQDPELPIERDRRGRPWW